jgi:hypothetical protein
VEGKFSELSSVSISLNGRDTQSLSQDLTQQTAKIIKQKLTAPPTCKASLWSLMVAVHHTSLDGLAIRQSSKR